MNLAFNFRHIFRKNIISLIKVGPLVEFVTGGVELLKTVLHGYAGGLIFMK